MKASKKIGVCAIDLLTQTSKGVVYITPANVECMTTAFNGVREGIKKAKISEAPEHTTDTHIAVRISYGQLEALASRREVGRITAQPA